MIELVQCSKRASCAIEIRLTYILAITHDARLYVHRLVDVYSTNDELLNGFPRIYFLAILSAKQILSVRRDRLVQSIVSCT